MKGARSLLSFLLLLFVCCSFVLPSFSDPLCGSDPDKSFDVSESTLNGNVINIVYLSEIVVLILTDSTYLYRTSDGGDTWSVVSTSVMQVYANADNSVAYVTQKNSTSSSVWAFSSSDASYTMKQYVPLNIPIFLQPHYLQPSLVASRMNNTLRITNDGFSTWAQIDNEVYFGDWGYNDSFYYKSDTSLKIVYSNFTSKTLLDEIYGIIAVKDVLFIAVPAANGGGLQLQSSKNRGQGPWMPAYFPDTFEEYQYTIYDVSVGSVIVGVVHDDVTMMSSNIYMSDTTDTRFARILSSVRRKFSGRIELKLTSVAGVMVANQYIEGKNGTVQTVISYDNGAKWQLLPPAIACSEKNCGTMLHISTRSDHETWGPFVVRSSAVGLILATGTIGPNVANTSPNSTFTYFSRTAGTSWRQVLPYSSVYDYADHGALMVLANNFNPTTTLSYSWNEGMDLTSCAFTNSPITVADVSSSPSPTSQSFFLHGKRADGTTALIHIDFSGLHERVCEFNDYEDWAVLGDECLLGQQVTYTRRKQTSECYNPLEYDTEIKSSICPCTTQDYECDICYTEEKGKCKNVCADPQNNYCNGTNDHFYLSQGYRLVPGTVCDVSKGLNLIPKRISCKAGTPAIAIVIVVVLIVVALIVGGVFLFKNERTRRWLEDRFDFIRGKGQNNAWDSLGIDGDMEADAPILNDEAIVNFSENSSPVR